MYDERWNSVPQIHYEVEEIKRSIRIEDAVRYYLGVEPNRAGFIRCPDPGHSDKEASCKVYQETNNCKCFSCQGYFTVFNLAAFSKGLDIKRDFPKICEEVCNDFGIDKYTVSNQRDVDFAINQLFGDEKHKMEYREFFPLTESELNLIGLFNDEPDFRKEDYKYSVDADTYFKKLLGFENITNVPEHLIELYGLEIKNETFYKDELPAKIWLTFEEAVEMGLEKPYEKEKYKAFPKIQEIWGQDDESKEYIENMIVNYFNEAYSSAKKNLEDALQPVVEYENTHNVEREKNFCDIYNKKDENNIVFSPTQQQRVNDYFSYAFCKNQLEETQKEFEKLEKINYKLSSFFQKRAEHENETESSKKNTNWEIE